MLNQGATPTRTAKRPRPEGSTPTERVTLPKMPRDSRVPETSREVLTNIKIGIFKENYREDKLIEDE
jgi:hypothetical protein